MANVITFHLFIEGDQDTAEGIVSRISCYDASVAVCAAREDGSPLCAVVGECRNGVASSMLRKGDPDNLRALSADFDCRLEIIGYDQSEPEWVEHYVYDRGELTYKGLDGYFFAGDEDYEEDEGLDEEDEEDFDEEDALEDGIERTPEERSLYEFLEGPGVYTLKPEFQDREEHFVWDEENGVMHVSLQLPGADALEQQLLDDSGDWGDEGFDDEDGWDEEDDEEGEEDE